MRTDYFDGLVPTVPTSINTSGDAANPHKYSVSPLSPLSPAKNGEAEKNAVGRVLHTNYGAGYRHPDGRVETGAPEPPPPPAMDWPADLNALLRRVSTAFEWTDADRRDFIAWARRSPEGLDDAARFLVAEAEKLPESPAAGLWGPTPAATRTRPQD